MKQRDYRVIEVVGGVLLAIIAGCLVAQTLAMNPSWEYTVISVDNVRFQDQMNAIGQRGWELVSVQRPAHDPSTYECILKRRR